MRRTHTGPDSNLSQYQHAIKDALARQAERERTAESLKAQREAEYRAECLKNEDKKKREMPKGTTWTAQEAATAAGVSDCCITHNVNQGLIDGVKIGREWRVSAAQVERGIKYRDDNNLARIPWKSLKEGHLK